MTYMFYVCRQFNQSSEKMECGKRIYAYMLDKCEEFNNNLNNWNVSKVEKYEMYDFRLYNN